MFSDKETIMFFLGGGVRGVRRGGYITGHKVAGIARST